MTPVNFNRHIFILNKLILQGPKSLVELRNEIKDELEAGSTCEIDKKSLKRVVENLKRKQLAKSVDFSVTISGEEQALEQTKTVVIPFDMDPSDPRIQRNPTILKIQPTDSNAQMTTSISRRNAWDYLRTLGRDS